MIGGMMVVFSGFVSGAPGRYSKRSQGYGAGTAGGRVAVRVHGHHLVHLEHAVACTVLVVMRYRGEMGAEQCSS